AGAHGHLAGCFGVGIVDGVRVPAVRGDLDDRGTPFPEKVPERFRGAGAREPATDADDRKRLTLSTLAGGELRLQFLNREERTLEGRQPGEAVGQPRHRLTN